MSQDRLLDTFLQLAVIPSPPRRERAAADFIAARLAGLGFHVEEDDAGCALGGDAGNLRLRLPKRGRGGHALVLCAHLDTVETGERPIKPIVEGDWVRSDGDAILGADDKAGVAVLIELLQRIKESRDAHGELLFLFTVGEEIGCSGAAVLDADAYRGFDAGIVVDFPGADELVVAAPTKVSLRLEAQGRGGHAAWPERTLNAAHILCQVLAQLPQGRLDEHTTANLGILRAGSAVNIIPERAGAEYEIRGHRRELLDFHLKHILGVVESGFRAARIPPSFPDASGPAAEPAVNSLVDVEVEVDYEGYRLADDAPAARIAWEAMVKAGLAPRKVVTHGGSDANIFNARGLPSTVIGCGYLTPHSVHERLHIPDMHRALETLWHACTAERPQ